MALTVTLEQLIADSALYADQRPTGANEFVGTTAHIRLINQKVRKWQDLLIALRPQDQIVAQLTDATFVTAGNDDYNIDALTPPYHSAVNLILLWTPTEPEVVPWIPVSEAPKYMSQVWSRGAPKGYTLGEENDLQIRFYPMPTVSVPAVFRYIPAQVALVASPGPPNTIKTVNGWENLIALEVAIDMLAIAGRDWSHLKPLRDSEVERLQALASEKVTTEAKEVRDVYPENPWRGRWPFGLPGTGP